LAAWSRAGDGRRSVQNDGELPMKLILTYTLTLGLGILVALGIASLIGLVLPGLKIWVFLIISLSWLYIGWKYAAARDRANQIRLPQGCDYILARDEIANLFVIANQEAEKESGQGEACSPGGQFYNYNSILNRR
jgi:hypothetical protein